TAATGTSRGSPRSPNTWKTMSGRVLRSSVDALAATSAGGAVLSHPVAATTMPRMMADARISEQSYEEGGSAASVRGLWRTLSRFVPGATVTDVGTPLEWQREASAPPRVAPMPVVEAGEPIRPVLGSAAAFGGF